MKNQKTILITGSTGFLGSAIAAKLLASGHRVIALSRNDSGGIRTRGAIEAAGTGMGIGLDSLRFSIATGLSVIECAFRDLAIEIPDQIACEVDEVWNCAANMNYSLSQLEESLAQNVAGVRNFYRRMAKEPRLKRFNHVSTAYTASFEAERSLIREELHPEALRVNAYQVSKWMGEMMLSEESGMHELPITIFRPSIIIGDRQTGWSAGKGFGYYMFIRSLQKMKERGSERVTIHLDPEVRPNVISIDDVVNAAVALSDATEDQVRDRFEIIHVVNPHTLTLKEHFAIASEAIGIEVRFGMPETKADERYQAGIELNREFAARTWNFESKRLRRRIGAASTIAPFTAEEMTRMVRVFTAALKSDSPES